MQVRLYNLGEAPYARALSAQLQLHDLVCSGECDAALLVLTHPSTFTMGRHANPQHILNREAISALGAEVHQVDRGGDITWHGPGQLVAYPIVSLERLQLSVRQLVCRLSDAVRGTLRQHGIEGHWRDDTPGVWVDHEKIAAVGLRIAKRVSRHGISLNVCPDLAAYEHIVPCGLKTSGVTSMREQLSVPISVDEVRPTLIAALLETLFDITDEQVPKEQATVERDSDEIRVVELDSLEPL